MAEHGEAHAIIAVTRGGKTARRLSALRPRVPILAMTERVEMARRLSLCGESFRWRAPSFAKWTRSAR